MYRDIRPPVTADSRLGGAEVTEEQ